MTDAPRGAPLSVPPTLVSLVIPAYNEAGCLEHNVRAVLAFCTESGLAAEVLVVDDGSTDQTGAVARSLAQSDERVRALANPANLGKGAAVRRGMLAATGDPVVFLDADLSTPIEVLPGLLEAFAGGSDVVIGSRRVADAQIDEHQPWLRESLGRGFTWLTRTWLGLPLADFTCGFKGFRAYAVRPILERQRLNDWSFDAELCFLATRLGYSIEQIPVTWRNDPNSKVRVGSAMLGALAGLWRIRWWGWSGRYDLP